MSQFATRIAVDYSPIELTKRDSFREATHRYWSGKESGCLLPYFYAHHNGKDGRKSMAGDEAWIRVTKEPHYYPAREEIKVFVKALPEMAKVVPQNLSMLDIGPGDKQALRRKSSKAVKAFEASRYIGLETSQEFAIAARQVFSPKLGAHNVDVLTIDAFQPATKPVCERAVIYFGGCTAGCLLGPVPSAPPAEKLSEMITAIASHAKEAFVVLSYADNTENPAQLLRAYNNPVNYDFKRNVLFRMADELDMRGFDPRLFQAISFFHPTSGCVAHMHIPTTIQKFTLDGEQYNVTPCKPYHAASSFQFARTTFNSAVKLSKTELLWHSHSRRSIKYVVLHTGCSGNNRYPDPKAI